jgi:hypothetical protein
MREWTCCFYVHPELIGVIDLDETALWAALPGLSPAPDPATMAVTALKVLPSTPECGDYVLFQAYGTAEVAR